MRESYAYPGTTKSRADYGVTGYSEYTVDCHPASLVQTPPAATANTLDGERHHRRIDPGLPCTTHGTHCPLGHRPLLGIGTWFALSARRVRACHMVSSIARSHRPSGR